MIPWEVKFEEITESHKNLFIAQMKAKDLECDFPLMLRTFLNEHNDEHGIIHEEGFTLSQETTNRFLEWHNKKHEGRSTQKDIDAKKRDGFTIWEVIGILIAQAVMIYFYQG